MDNANTVRPDGRTGLVTLTDEECWAELRSAGVGRLAVTVGSTVDIFPVNYFVRAGDVVIRTEAGTKFAAATLMRSVAFEVDQFDTATRKGWSVVVKGHGREPVTVEEQVELDELGTEPWVDAPKTRWLVVTPYEVTGRRVP